MSSLDMVVDQLMCLVISHMFHCKLNRCRFVYPVLVGLWDLSIDRSIGTAVSNKCWKFSLGIVGSRVGPDWVNKRSICLYGYFYLDIAVGILLHKIFSNFSISRRRSEYRCLFVSFADVRSSWSTFFKRHDVFISRCGFTAAACSCWIKIARGRFRTSWLNTIGGLWKSSRFLFFKKLFLRLC